MSHPAQLQFFALVAEANARALDGGAVLEIGSYDVNGSMRSLFGFAGRYVGVDLTEGPGVDVVGFGHELDEPDGSFDLALSGECLEHDSHWPRTLTTMARVTRPGGLVAFSCAGRGRLEHGTRRTNPEASPGTQAVGSDYYRNLAASDVERAVPLASLFAAWRFGYAADSCDLFFAGIRSGSVEAGAPLAALPDWADVAAIRSPLPPTLRAATLAMRPLARVLPDETYQSVMLPVRQLGRRLRSTRG